MGNETKDAQGRNLVLPAHPRLLRRLAGNVWIAGNGDGVVQKWTRDGSTMLLQIGQKFTCDCRRPGTHAATPVPTECQQEQDAAQQSSGPRRRQGSRSSHRPERQRLHRRRLRKPPRGRLRRQWEVRAPVGLARERAGPVRGAPSGTPPWPRMTADIRTASSWARTARLRLRSAQQPHRGVRQVGTFQRTIEVNTTASCRSGTWGRSGRATSHSPQIATRTGSTTPTSGTTRSGSSTARSAGGSPHRPRAQRGRVRLRAHRGGGFQRHHPLRRRDDHRRRIQKFTRTDDDDDD